MPETLETMVVDDVMTRWPDSVSVFLRHRMACPGCVMAPFMTVREAAREYDLDPRMLTRELAEAIGSEHAQ